MCKEMIKRLHQEAMREKQKKAENMKNMQVNFHRFSIACRD